MNGRASGEVRYRAVPLGGSLKAHFAPQADGSVIVTSTEPLLPYAARITDRFLHWAEAAPDRTLVAKRLNGGDWRRVTYGEALINEQTDQTLLGTVQARFMGPATRARVLYFLVGHTWDIYGQMVVYLRLNGKVPPASQRP